MKKINILLVFLLFTVLITPSLFANLINQNLPRDTEQIRPVTISHVEGDAGIWVVVTKKDYPLQDRKIECYSMNRMNRSSDDISNNYNLVGEYKTNQDGVIYTRLKTGSAYKFVDVLTNTEVHFHVDQTFPQMVQLVIFNEVVPIGNSILSISTRDNSSFNGIPFSTISIYDEKTGELVLQRDTDEAGRLRIRTFNVGNYTFTASARGYESVKLYDLKIVEGVNNIDFIMNKSETIENTAGIKITIKDKNSLEEIPLTEVLVYNEKGSVVYKDITDRSGFLYIKSLDKGNYTFVFNARGYQSHKIEHKLYQNDSLEVYLTSVNYQPPVVSEYGKLKIQVTDSLSTRPMSFVSVNLYSYEKGESVSYGSTFTDDFGIAYFEEFPLNIDVTIKVESEGYNGFKKVLNYNQEYNSLQVRLTKEGLEPVISIDDKVNLRILVNDINEDPLSRANIEIISNDSRQGTLTDQSGTAIFSNLSSRKLYTIIISKEGYEPIKKTNIRFREDFTITFNLNKIDDLIDNTSYVKVLVLDRESQTPLQNVDVSFTGVDTRTLYSSAITDEFGVAYFKSIPLNKNIRINSNAKGYDFFSREIIFSKEYDSFEVRLRKTDYSAIERDIVRQASRETSRDQLNERNNSNFQGLGNGVSQSSVSISNIDNSNVYSDIEDKRYYQTNSQVEIELIDFEKAIENNNMSSERIVSQPEIVNLNGEPTYIFQIREQRKLFNIIPMGQKIMYRAVSAIYE
jgi:hypothetical protein